MDFPKDLKYTKSHEWARIEGKTATCGITSFAAEHIGDVVQLELPEVGRKYAREESIAVIESSKASEEIFAPLTGKIVAVNKALEQAPEKVNESPFGDGWIFKIEIVDPSETAPMLDAQAYAAHVAESTEN